MSKWEWPKISGLDLRTTVVRIVDVNPFTQNISPNEQIFGVATPKHNEFATATVSGHDQWLCLRTPGSIGYICTQLQAQSINRRNIK